MLIGIDGNEANVTNKVGVGQYAFKLLWQLSQIDTKNQYIIYLKNTPDVNLPKASQNWQYRVFGPQKLWTRFTLPFRLLIQKEKLDLFFSPSHYSPSFCPCPTIPTIHDIGYLQFQDQFTQKDFYQLKNWTLQSIKKAKHIVTVSQFSKDEIVKTYQINPQKITIAYNGVDTPPTIDQKIQQKILSSYLLKANDYFLYLGTLKPNKNIPFLIKSFALFLKQTPSVLRTSPLDKREKLLTPCPVKGRVGEGFVPKLVIAGKKGWLFDEIYQTVKQEGIEDKVVFTDFVTEEQKWVLYQNAIASVLPSTYEGFGIPAIESMKIGTPVIVSNIPPFKEVVKNCGLFIDPNDITDLCQKMIEILDPKIGLKYSKLGQSQADNFSWESCAKSVISVFESAK